MRKLALGSFPLIGVLSALACSESGNDAPMAPAPVPQPANLTYQWTLSLNISAEGLGLDASSPLSYSDQWTLLMDGAVLETQSCDISSGPCSAFAFGVAPMVKTGAHTITVRLDNGFGTPRDRYVIYAGYTARSHDSNRFIRASFEPREVSLADGESTSFTFELPQS